MAEGPSEWDVELVRAQTRGAALLMLTRRGSVALCIAALALPVWMMQGVVDPLAGKTTHVLANVPITFVMSVSLIGNLAQFMLFEIQRRSTNYAKDQNRALTRKLEVDKDDSDAQF
jgi:hypothetical protein